MHSPRILDQFGCSQARLRQIFTATGPTKRDAAASSNGADAGSSPEESLTTRGTQEVPYQGSTTAPNGQVDRTASKKLSDWEIRSKFEFRIRSRTLAAIGTNLSNARPLQAVDMAWDAPPIQKETYPLMLWAQGKIKNDSELADLLTSTISTETARKFVKKKADGTMIVDVPRICDFSINLVRSYVTRRHAAIAALWDNLWPLLKYDPRGTDEIATLLADATTQRMDIMADEYNYRHFLSQCDRDKLLYGQSLIFPRSAWDRQQGIRYQESNTGEPTDRTESYVKQEGVDPVAPHPSRWLWDLGAPLANINTNNGPKWIGYWDIVPYATILDGDYFNKSHVWASDSWALLIQQNALYFAQYFDKCVLTLPNFAMCSDPALVNDRPANIGLYTAEMRDKGVLVTPYFEKVNPKVEGIGDYDADVWLRLTAAGDGTIVAAEFMPSLPACYGGINCNDNRVANASLAMEVMWAQDACSNVVSQMIQQLRVSFMMLVMLDEDSLDPEIVKDIKSSASNMEWWMDPKFLLYSASKLKELGVMDPSQAFKIIQAQVTNTVDQSMRSLGQILSLADRVVNSSPNELGQPNPREVSARETQEQATSVQSVYAFYNEGPREQRGAFKRMTWESLMCHGQETFEVPVIGRYRKSTIKEAGFELTRKIQGGPDTLLKSGVRITGKIRDLDFDYVYTSRDGAERASNTQGAQVLQQLLVGMIQLPGVAQKLGPQRIFTMMNVIARMAGAPDEFQVALDDGEEEVMEDGTEGELPPEVQKAVQGVMKDMQALAMQNQQLAGVVGMIAQKIGIVIPQQGQAPQGAPPPAGGPPTAPTAPTAPAPTGAPMPPSGGPPAAQPANGARLLQ